MFNLFNPPFESLRTPIELPIFAYLNKQTDAEIKKVIDHYNHNVYQSDVSVRLFKILAELKQYIHLSPETLFRYVRNNTAKMCMAYNIVSPVSNGSITSMGELYNRNIAELFISVEYPVDVQKAIGAFENLKPVRVISHDFSDFSYGLVDGKYACQEKGLAIFTIDLALLAIQYQHWYNNLRFIEKRNYYLPTTHFIARYLWTGILPTHMDNVLFNRLVNLVKNKKNQVSRNSQSFYLTDYSARYDDGFRQLLDRWKAGPSDWLARLNSIPSIKYGSYWQAIAMPDAAPTRQLKWAAVLSKLKVLEFLLLTDQYNTNNAMNRSEQIALERDIRILFNDKSLEMYLPENLIERVKWVYDQLNLQQP